MNGEQSGKLVSVIIPSYNRFSFLMNAIKSVKNQTYENIEIIVVNDCSTEKDYYSYDWVANGITIIHLSRNTKDIFGFASIGYVRNRGIDKANGKYIAFCDDDDIWLPKKIERQISEMIRNGCNMSSTEGYFGLGVYDKRKKYKMYNSEHYYEDLRRIYREKKSKLLDDGFSKIWKRDFIKVHNFIICSCVVIEKELLDKIGRFHNIKPPGEDYNLWLRALEHTTSLYIDDALFYYDGDHGSGRNY